MKYTIIQNTNYDNNADSDKILFGLADSSGKIILDCNYSYISIIKNYSDLSLNNFTDIYLLGDTSLNNDTYAYFAYIENQKFIVSKSSYLFYKNTNSEPNFYKGLTICKSNSNKKEELIINLNEDVIGGPYDEGLSDCDNGHNIIIKKYRSKVSELCRIYDLLGYEYGYGNELKSFFYKERNETLYYLTPGFPWSIDLEEQLGYDIVESESMFYKSVLNYNLKNGLALVEDYGKFKFINRYYFEVGESFDELLSKENFSKYLKDVQWEEKYNYIKINNTINKIQFTGDFITEVCLNPLIFIDDENFKNYVKSKRFCDVSIQPSLNSIVNKIDASYLYEMEINARYNNENFLRTSEWEKEVINTEMFNDDFINHHFKFIIPPNSDLNMLKNKIHDFNQLFGESYSGYEILETFVI